MSIVRVWVLCLCVGAIALTVVLLRAGQRQAVASAVRAELRTAELRRERWELQSALARLQTHDRLMRYLRSLETRQPLKSEWATADVGEDVIHRPAVDPTGAHGADDDWLPESTRAE